MLSATPAAWVDAAGILTVDAGSLADDGQSDSFSLARQGDQLQISVSGQEAFAGNVADLSAIRIQGSGDRDILTIDFSGGDPRPAGGIEFLGNGGGLTVGDSLILVGQHADTLIQQFNGGGDGSFQLMFGSYAADATSASIRYTDVGSVHSQLPADHLIMRSADASATLLISDTASNTTTNSGALLRAGLLNSDRVFASTEFLFSNPAESLAVSGGSIQFDASLSVAGGKVTLNAARDGILSFSGRIDVSDTSPGEIGGEVSLTGGRVELLAGSRIEANGDAGGGSVIVWADQEAASHGAISARGMKGGYAEISGGESIVFARSADLTGTSGIAGRLVLDPDTIDIDALLAATIVQQLTTSDVTLIAASSINVLAEIDAIGSPGHQLTLVAPTIAFSDAADIVNEGNLLFQGDLVLADGASVLLSTSSSGSDISVQGSVFGTAFGPGENLTFQSDSGTIRVAGTIGQGATLDTLNVNAGSGDIWLESMVEGVSAVTLNTSGTTNILGPLGGSDPIGRLFTDADGVTRIGAGITASGTLEFNDAIELTADVTLTSHGLAGVFFRGTVDGDGNGPWNLTVETTDLTAVIEFDDAVGGSQPLAGLTIHNAGLLTMSSAADVTLLGDFFQSGSGIVETAADVTTDGGSVTYMSAVTLTGDAAITSTTGDIVFQGLLDAWTGGGESLSLSTQSGNITFHDIVGGTTPLGTLEIITAADVEFLAPLTAGNLIQQAGTGMTTIHDNVTTFASAGLDLTADRVVLDGTLIATSGHGIVRFNAVTELTGDTLVDAAGTISFLQEVTAPSGNSLTLASDENIRFQDAGWSGPGNTFGALTITRAVDVEAFGAIDAASIVQTAGSGVTTLHEDVTTAAPEGLDLATARVVLDGLTINAGGDGGARFDAPVELVGSVAIVAGGTIRFLKTVLSPGGGDLHLDSGADIYFEGPVGAAFGDSLGQVTIEQAVDVEAFSTINAGSLTQLAGSGTTTLHDDVTTSGAEGVALTTSRVVLDGLVMTADWEGAVTFDAPVELTGDVVINAGSDIRFLQTVVSPISAASNLTLGTEANVAFQEAVGNHSGGALGAITITRAANVDVFGTIEAAGLTQLTGSGTTSLHSDVTTYLQGIDLSTMQVVLDDSDGLLSLVAAGGGIVRFNAPVELVVNTTIDAGGPITFVDSITSSVGAFLTLASDSDVRFEDSVGPDDAALGDITIARAVNVDSFGTIEAASLTQLAGYGTTTLRYDVTTSGPDGVQLTAARVVLDGLAITAVGGGSASFDAPVELTGDVAINAEAGIRFVRTLLSPDNSAFGLTLGTDGDILFQEAVGNVSGDALGAVTITSAVNVEAMLTIDAASVVQQTGTGTTTFRDGLRTSAPQGLDITTDNVVLDGLEILTGGGGIVRFDAAVDLSGDAGVNADGTITFEQVLTSSANAALTLTSEADILFRNTVGSDAGDAIGPLTIVNAVNVTADSSVFAASLVQLSGSGTTTLRGNVTTTAPEGVDITSTHISLDSSTPDVPVVIGTNGGLARLNGPVTLASEAIIETAGGDIVFTRLATIDGEPLTNSSLTLSADSGSVSFHANIGDVQPIGRLVVTRADGGVSFGGPGNPVTSVQTLGEIDIGNTDAIAGGITLDAGDGKSLLFSTTSGRVRMNGPVELNSDAEFDTTDAGSANGAEIRFTRNAPINSEAGEDNDLILNAGIEGTVTFNANIGADRALGQLIIRSAYGVAFGNNEDVSDPDFAPVDTVRVDGDPDPANLDAFDIDIGSNTPIGEGTSTLNGGDGGSIVCTTTADRVRFNGAIVLESDARVDTSDGGAEAGDEIRFTLNATIDSRSTENNDLVLSSGATGIVNFNADIGAIDPLGQLIVTEAMGVVFGGDAGIGDPDFAPVSAVRLGGDLDPSNPDAFDIDIGSASPIGDAGIILNGGDGRTIAFTTTADRVRFNGETQLWSDASIDTTDGGLAAGAEIRFTLNAPVDSQGGENNGLTLSAGAEGTASFNADIGASHVLGHFVVTDAYGVTLGNAPTEPDFAHISSINVDDGAAPSELPTYGVDLGRSSNIGDGGIVLDAGEGNTLAINTAADRVRLNGAVTMRSDAIVDTTFGNAAPLGADILVDGSIDGAADGPTANLSLVSHSGAITVTGVVGGLVPLGALSLQDNHLESTGPAVFRKSVYATSLVTFGRTYAVEFRDGGMIQDAVEFLNTGGVVLGDEAGDTTTFGNGLISVASDTSIGGTVETLDLNIEMRNVRVIANSHVRTAGGTVLFRGFVDSEAEEFNDLELTAEAGAVEFRADIGSQWALNQLVVNSADSVVFGRDFSPVHAINVLSEVDLGRDSTIAQGIQLNGGAGGLLALNTTGGPVRLNGPVELQSSVRIRTSDNGSTGAGIRFTQNAPVDSQSGETNYLTLSAGTGGTVNFNADIGSSVALGRLVVTEASEVAFGSDVDLADSDLAPLSVVRVTGDPANPGAWGIDLGSVESIGPGGIKLNAGDGSTISIVTTADKIRFNGAVELQSNVLLDTTDGNAFAGAETRFTIHAPIDSQPGEHNNLTLTAGTAGIVNFNGDIGAVSAPGRLVVTDARGVMFGNDSFDPQLDLGPISFVRLDGDPIDPSAWALDVGSVSPIGDLGIWFDAGHTPSSQPLTLHLTTTGDAVRLNGAVQLRSDVAMDTSDSDPSAGAQILFTNNAPIDSRAGQSNDLTLTAGTGGVEFNTSIGSQVALDRLEVTRADNGVIFGGADDPGGGTGDQGPVPIVNAIGGINIGSISVITGGIVLNAGADQRMEVGSDGTDIRFNGFVTLASHVAISTGDSTVGDIVFTDESTIDSDSGERNELVLTAGLGRVAFNADLGTREALSLLEITQADGGVVFGEGDTPDGDMGDLGPVGFVYVTAYIDVGSLAPIAGGIVLNAGQGVEMVVQASEGFARWNGPIELRSPAFIDTSAASGDITFTDETTIDSVTDEYNSLRLNSAGGGIFFNANVGTGELGDQTIGNLTVEMAGTIVTAASRIWTSGDIDFFAAPSDFYAGDILISEVAPGLSEIVGRQVTMLAGGLITIENGASVAAFSNGGWVTDPIGRVSNIPPLLRIVPPDPNRGLNLTDRVQVITGTFGGEEEKGDNLELGSNFTLVVVWDDGITNTITNLHAGDHVVLHVSESGEGEPVITHVSDTGPIHYVLSHEYTIAHLLTVTEYAYATINIFDDSAIYFQDVRPFDLNEVGDYTRVRVAREQLLYAELPKEFVPPAPLRPVDTGVALFEATQISVEGSRRLEDLAAIAQTNVANVRLIYIVRVSAGGAESDPYLLPDDALNNLTALFEKFKTEGLPDGRYRIYLKEVGFPPRKVVEFYKSGDTFGDPIREPGRGSNPLPKEEAEAGLPRSSGARSMEQPHHRGDGNGGASSPASALFTPRQTPDRLVQPAVAELAASLEAVRQSLSPDSWAQRIDDALQQSSSDIMSRGARLRRQLQDP